MGDTLAGSQESNTPESAGACTMSDRPGVDSVIRDLAAGTIALTRTP